MELFFIRNLRFSIGNFQASNDKYDFHAIGKEAA